MAEIPAVLNDGLGFNLYRAALLFRRELARALEAHGLTPEQWQILAALWSTEAALSQRDVAELTLKDKYTVSRILGRLERDGWVERRADAADARVVRVRPSARANERRAAMPAEVGRHFEPILNAFSERERAELVRLLRRMRRLMGDEAA